MFSPSKILRNTLKTHRKLSRASQILPPKTRNFWHRSNLCKDGEKSMEKEKSKDAKVKEETEFERALREAREEAESEPVKSETAVKKLTIWEKIKHEASHYWHGSKLLAAETSISSRLLLKTLKGKPLTRREYRQEERKKNVLKVRIQMAKFLQETVGEVALSGTSKTDAAKEFNEFFYNVRNSGVLAKKEDILKVSRKFQDELTLTNLSRPQLVSLARFMSINAFGTDAFLRTQIENKLKAIAADDRMIIEDGVNNLSISELQQACMARGLSFNGVSPNRMKNELTQWLDLHLEHKVPSSLLLLSNAFQTTGRPFQTGTSYLDEKAEALQATLSSLPHQVINEASLKISEEEGVATNKQKLDVLREQEELIEDELEQEQLASEKQKEAKENKDGKTSEKEEKTSTEQKENSSIVVETKVETVHSTEKVDLKLPVEEPVEADLESELSEEEKQKLVDALKTMTSDSAINDVKETFHELKEDRQDFIQDVEEYKEFTKKTTPASSDRLGSRIDKMIASIEAELQKYDTEIGSKLNLVKPNVQGQISIQDLEETLRAIRDHPNDDRIKKIVTKLDSDKDGFVALNELLTFKDENTEKKLNE